MDSEVFKRRRFLPADLKPLDQKTIDVERSTELAPGRIKKQRYQPQANSKIKANADPYGLVRKQAAANKVGQAQYSVITEESGTARASHLPNKV